MGPELYEFLAKADLAERGREAEAIRRAAEAERGSAGLRASFAAKLASLALRMDGEAARRWLAARDPVEVAPPPALSERGAGDAACR